MKAFNCAGDIEAIDIALDLGSDNSQVEYYKITRAFRGHLDPRFLQEGTLRSNGRHI
jgi:hypothetical protein